MEWSREKRYRSYSSWTAKQVADLREQAKNSLFRPGYHISPTSGLLNDPNGFSYFAGKWHVFYQNYPYGPVHGLKSWVHCISTDLVHWQDLGVSLQPSSQYDSHGVYSGSALPVGKQLLLAYTGNVRDENWERISYQNAAWMNSENQITKNTTPLLSQPEHVTGHFRDPQLFAHQGAYYMLVGAQDKQTTQGEFAWFKSTDLNNWQDLGYITHPFNDLGFMVECPNLVEVDGRPVLIFCPQGLPQAELEYANIYPNVYSVGRSFDFEKGQFTADPGCLKNLDDGFDVYASQAFNSPDGHVYLISWIGLPEIEYPTDKENWANCLSIVKELHVKNGQLYQRPLPAQEELVVETRELQPVPVSDQRQTLVADAGQQYELELQLPANQAGNLLLAGSKTTNSGIKINFSTGKAAKLVVDRADAGQQFAKKYGQKRRIELKNNEALKLTIFIDHSVCEIFINDGQNVLTLRYFAPQEQTEIAFNGSNELKYSGSYKKLDQMRN